ncbi:unnamed protein product [Closterium sp. NIES-53]
MALLRVLAFDHEGRPVAFDTGHNDLQLYLLSDIKDSVSLFDHGSGVAPAPPATADGGTRSQWLSCDATARLAIRNHLPLSAFATVADLVTHLRTSDARYRATVPAKFLATNQPPMFITLYFIVSRLPDSLRSVWDHFLSLDPTSLIVDLLKQHLLAAKTSAVAVGAARGTPRLPFFEECSPSPLSPSFASAAAADVSITEDVGAASTSAKRRSSKGKGGRGGGGGSGGGGGGSGSGGGGSGGGGGGSGGGGGGGTGGGSGGSGGGGGGSGGSGGRGGGGTGGGRSGPRRGGPGGGQQQQQQRRSETQSPQQFRIAATALGASASGTPLGTAPAEALHTFTLDSGASRCLHLPSFSTNLVSTAALQDAMVTTTTPGGSNLCTLATEPPHVAESAQVSASGQVAASSLCCLLLHQTLLWHHRLGHPSLPRLRGMHSRFLVSGLPRSLPPLPPSLAPPCFPYVKGWQRTAPHFSSFPLTTAPLQTLHMDVVGPSPLRLQLRERFGTDLLVLRLHSDRGAEFSSDLLRYFCRGEGILQSFTLPDSPQKNGIAERRIGLVMEVARTSMIHAAAPHFLWLFAVRYAAHQLNLWPRVSLPETSPTLRWTGKVGNASVFRVWGSRAFVRDTSADKLSARTIPCVFLGFVPDAPGWQFYHPTLRRVLPSQDITFDESLPLYCLFPFHCAPPLPLPLFLAPGPPPVDPLPPEGPVSDAAPRTASGGAEPGGVGSEGAGFGGAEPGGAEPEGVELGGAESEGTESGGAAPRGAALSGGPAGALPRLSSQQLREWIFLRAHRRSGAPGAGGAGDTGAGGAAVTTGAGGTGGDAATGPGGARTSGSGAAGTGGVGCAGAGDPTEPGAAGTGGDGAGGAEVGGSGAGGAGAAGAGAVDPVAGGAEGTVRPRPYFVPLLQQSGGLTEHREPVSRPVSPVCTTCRAPRSPPPHVPGTHAMALRPSSVPLRVPLPAPTESSLSDVPDRASDQARAACPSVSRLLATAVTDPSFESTAASALVAELLEFAAACRLDYATALVGESVCASPPSVGGECALGADVLEDRQEDFECLAAAVPRLASMLLGPEGDPDAPDIPIPRYYAEAITGPYSSQWQAAMDAEMASWKSTGTIVDEVPPSRANIVDGMWIFRVKRPPSSPPAFKARYVARGFSKRQWRDYELHSLDFSTAFLQGSPHEEIWLCRPPGFTVSFPVGTQWSLRRPVYGPRQAPREWHDTLRTTLASLGFAPSTTDPSLFLRTDTSQTPLYVLVYVDDLVFATTDTEAVALVKSELQKRHTCTDLGPLVLWFPVLLATAHSSVYRPFTLSSTFGRVRRAEWSIPRACGLPHIRDDLHTTRPRVPSQPSGSLRGFRTSGMGLVLGGRGPVVLTGHAVASWVDDSGTQRSSQGYTFSLGSGSVSWRSTRSSSVLSSSCEAEIYAGAMAAQELRWLTYLLTDLGEQPRSPLVLYVDNKAMIALCQEHRPEHSTKHIALRYFLARELQQRGQLRLAYVATRANTTDVFTKALPPGDHQRFVTVLGLVPTLPHLLTA